MKTSKKTMKTTPSAHTVTLACDHKDLHLSLNRFLRVAWVANADLILGEPQLMPSSVQSWLKKSKLDPCCAVTVNRTTDLGDEMWLITQCPAAEMCSRCGNVLGQSHHACIALPPDPFGPLESARTRAAFKAAAHARAYGGGAECKYEVVASGRRSGKQQQLRQWIDERFMYPHPDPCRSEIMEPTIIELQTLCGATRTMSPYEVGFRDKYFPPEVRVALPHPVKLYVKPDEAVPEPMKMHVRLFRRDRRMNDGRVIYKEVPEDVET